MAAQRAAEAGKERQAGKEAGGAVDGRGLPGVESGIAPRAAGAGKERQRAARGAVAAEG